MTLVIEQSAARYVRTPLLTRVGSSAALSVVGWEPTGERPWISKLAPDGTLLELLPVAEPDPAGILGHVRVLDGGATLLAGWLTLQGPRAVELDRETLRPQGEVRRAGDGQAAAAAAARATASSELVAIEGPRKVVCVVAGGRSRVELHGHGKRPIVVWAGEGTALAPALAPDPRGDVWVAWHSNATGGAPDVPKWIELRKVGSDGVVRVPTARMTGRDLGALAEQQSFEFPSLVVHPSGAVTLFGRGSHRFWMQQLDEHGFGARVPLGDGDWGCRGRRVSAIALEGGDVLGARRERRGIVVERFAPPPGGAPRARALEVPRTRRLAPPSRPRRPRDADGLRLLFGDVHQHSAHSDGVGAADEAYFRARDHYGDDFAALTDHESFLGKRIGPGEQALLETVAESHDEPGRFSTLLAYEWTAKMFPGPGHKVVYVPRAGLPILSRDDPATASGAGLLEAVRRQGGFAVPHHTGWTGADAGAHNPIDQPVWEICSCHGCYESCGNVLGHRGALPGQFVREALEAGLVFGFVGASDSHGLLWHHGVSRKRDPFRTGLTAVAARANERAAILDALRARRCYATSGAKILLDVRLAGQPMGSELVHDGEVALTARARGTAAVARLVLVGHGGDLESVEAGAAEDARASWTVRADPARGWSFFYVRVEQADGERAWSSPVWVRRRVTPSR